MNKGTINQARNSGNVTIAVAAIGSLSILLVAGLALLGLLDRVNLLISSMASQGKAGGFPKSLPGWAEWLFVILLAFGISFAILGVAGTWRRVMLWLTALVLIAGWAPVLALAAHAPDIGGPWVATLWSGVCALVYAGNHRMPCDAPSKKPPSDEAR